MAIVSWGARVLARLAAGACWILVGPADPLPEYLGGTTVVGAVAWLVKVIDQRWSWQLPVTSQLQRIETQHWQRGGEGGAGRAGGSLSGFARQGDPRFGSVGVRAHHGDAGAESTRVGR